MPRRSIRRRCRRGRAGCWRRSPPACWRWRARRWRRRGARRSRRARGRCRTGSTCRRSRGWQRVPVAAHASWSPWHPGADHQLFGRYADAQGEAVDMALAAFAGQGEGRKLAAFGTGALRQADRWIRIADLPEIDGGRAMRIVAQEKDGTTVERVVVTWYRVGDTLTGDDATVKYATMKDRLAGGTQTAVALHLSAIATPGQDAVAAIRRLRASLGPLDRAIDGIVARAY
ncbi:exosortase C-terminal domain/associated protein EpsI [Sphingomonas adhaesiva]|uniref:exosortase C-terminal domain/associated protein EpsI n=1 Tax=Sphingomonas adhaesiva TaxID=28212 RepID=UPI002FF802EC